MKAATGGERAGDVARQLPTAGHFSGQTRHSPSPWSTKGGFLGAAVLGGRCQRASGHGRALGMLHFMVLLAWGSSRGAAGSLVSSCATHCSGAGTGCGLAAWAGSVLPAVQGHRLPLAFICLLRLSCSSLPPVLLHLKQILPCLFPSVFPRRCAPCQLLSLLLLCLPCPCWLSRLQGQAAVWVSQYRQALTKMQEPRPDKHLIRAFLPHSTGIFSRAKELIGE